MIQHSIRNAPLGVPLYRRHRGEFQAIGTALSREATSYGARMTIRTPEGKTLDRAFGHATKLYMDENQYAPVDTDATRIASWMEQQALSIQEQAETYHAGSDDESFYEDLAKHITDMAASVRAGQWGVAAV